MAPLETVEQSDGAIVVAHGSRSWLAKGLVIAGLGLLAGAAYDWFEHVSVDDKWAGFLGAGAMCVVTGLALAEKGRFRFDRRSRTLDWERQHAWSRKSGSVPFAQIRLVMIERPLGDEGIPSRRIVLRLADGTNLPMRAAYVPDHGDELLRLAERLRTLIGLDANPPVEEPVRALIEQGRKIEAIKLLREQKGLSLADAKREVDELDSRPR